MANLLFLAHRLPYPPNKGDKVRSYHLLRYLGERHRVFVGTFVDEPEDGAHLHTVRSMCTELRAVRLGKRLSRVASLRGLLRGEALTLAYYRRASLRAWVDDVLSRERIDAAIVFSSSMAQYAQGCGVPMLVDFVDVDSAKWTEYASMHRWPMSWLYRREGRKLLQAERMIAERAAYSFFVTQKEADLFRERANGTSARVETMSNGVDADYFCADLARPSPFGRDEIPLVFTGAMDYWPNVDAVTWFVQEMLPDLRAAWPSMRFHIVGRSPTPAVRSLAGAAVHVTGTVPDVRPYLQHAAVVVAPMRLARGIQNKILEAMAMARPLVASAQCVASLDVEPRADVMPATTPADFVREISALLREPERARDVGAAARERMRHEYRWGDRLAPLGRQVGVAVGARLVA